MAEKQNPGQPGLGGKMQNPDQSGFGGQMQNPGQPGFGGQMQNPYPPQYGAQPPPPLEQGTVILQHIQPEAPVSPLQITPREPEQRLDSDYEHDIYKLTPHVEIGFDDTFTEPDEASGLKCMTVVNKNIYQCTHLLVYAGPTMLIGPVMTFMCGITIALNHLIIIWMVQPCIKLSFLWCRIVNMFFSTCVRMFIEPCFKSSSLLFSEIKGRIRVDTSDITLNMKTSQIQHV